MLREELQATALQLRDAQVCVCVWGGGVTHPPRRREPSNRRSAPQPPCRWRLRERPFLGAGAGCAQNEKEQLSEELQQLDLALQEQHAESEDHIAKRQGYAECCRMLLGDLGISAHTISRATLLDTVRALWSRCCCPRVLGGRA
eukprot:COSAG01_NODE_7743_length_3076_cov_2.001344_4_plen_144_part_00